MQKTQYEKNTLHLSCQQLTQEQCPHCGKLCELIGTDNAFHFIRCCGTEFVIKAFGRRMWHG